MVNGIVLNIDTTKSEFQNPMIELRQGDGNYQSIDVTVTSNGSPFNLTGWTITFMGTTAGGFKIVDASVSNVDTANGKFTYTPTKAWGQDEGMFKEAYFKFTSGANGNSVASGASIRVNVLTAVDLTAEEAGDYISIVDQTIATLNEDLTTLQLSVDQLKAQNNAIKTTDNTWTGTNTFNKQITGSLKTRPATFTNFTQVASDMISYAGLWVVDNKSITGAPDGLLNYIVEVIPGSWSGNGIIFISSYTTEEEYVARVDGQLKIWFKLSNDEKVVHNTGTETIAGDKTFTGNNTFTNHINGALSTRQATFTDFATVASDMDQYAGLWFVNAQTMLNSPISGTLYGIIEVIPAYGSITGIIRYSNVPNWGSGNYVTTVDNGAINGWEKTPDNASVVHNTGTETVAGNKTFTGDNNFSGATTLKTGNYGLRVTTAGIQKTSDNGVTWTNI